MKKDTQHPGKVQSMFLLVKSACYGFQEPLVKAKAKVSASDVTLEERIFDIKPLQLTKTIGHINYSD